MRLRSRICASGFLTAVCLAIPSLAAAAPMAPDAASSPQSLAGAAPACGQPAPGQVRCDALITTNRAGRAVVSDSPSQGYGPADLHAAYNLPAGGGNGQVIAVVDAYDDPGAEADLGIYRANYGLPA